MVNRTAVAKWSHKWEHQTQSEEHFRRDYSLPPRYPAPPYKLHIKSNSKDPKKFCRYCKNRDHMLEEEAVA
ncbi:hypothetical protein HZH66_014639 [Vespula vulgaris]|uniref:Uncharacterized protein n=1 Tax=Vespula vulgaris TaxID=7454 RepID=A0A834MQV1_VESVU|nr:hypothetical protein HZH66_014639 [Vespula vulgaris]